MTACGSTTSAQTSNSTSGKNSEITSNDPTDAELDPPIYLPEDNENTRVLDGVDDSDQIVGRGDFRHDVGDCVFYTENNLDSWINDGVFDFYGMMNYFGLTDRWPGIDEENSYCAVTPAQTDHVLVLFECPDSSWEYNSINMEFGDGRSALLAYTISDHSEYKTVRLPNKVHVSYEALEILLYAMECADEDDYAVVDDLLMLNLPEKYWFVTN